METIVDSTAFDERVGGGSPIESESASVDRFTSHTKRSPAREVYPTT
ncbi:hypothetical protein G9C85_12170 [Halorubellus sp. JP-L1]|nr:hypothetical protein [Halorubellus sp. JP-L1]NHN42377.1 hypothetical protein [Halorubellus sp. JP-L1]